MKRLFVMILIAILITGCTAKEEPAAQVSKEEPTTESNGVLSDYVDEVQSLITLFDTEEHDITGIPENAQVLLDKDGVVVTFTGKRENVLGIILDINVINNTDIDIRAFFYHTIFNDGILVEPIQQIIVTAGKQADGVLFLFISDLETAGLSDIEKVTTNLYIYKKDNFEEWIIGEAGIVIEFND